MSRKRDEAMVWLYLVENKVAERGIILLQFLQLPGFLLLDYLTRNTRIFGRLWPSLSSLIRLSSAP